MKIFPEPLEFEWDKGNIDKNLHKHNVINKEAEQAFVNKPKFIFKDEKHSQIEDRYGLFGKTDEERFISAVFMIRKNAVRIITARDMSRRERNSYEKIKKNSPV